MRPDRQTRANTFPCRPRVWEGGEAPSGGVGGKTSQEETTARVSLPMAFGVMEGGSWLTSSTSVWRVHVLNGAVPNIGHAYFCDGNIRFEWLMLKL